MYPAPIYTTKNNNTTTSSIIIKNPEWPLQEYEERRIMDALSQSPSLYSEKDDVELESPTTSYFSDRAIIFQLHKNTQIRKHYLSNFLRCSVCQRRFHSQGNLSNHKQLYH